jgi:hypothetical protein
LNTYGYVGGNPLRFVDPQGKFEELENWWDGYGWSSNQEVIDNFIKEKNYDMSDVLGGTMWLPSFTSIPSLNFIPVITFAR